jgi:hypothetical protein
MVSSPAEVCRDCDPKVMAQGLNFVGFNQRKSATATEQVEIGLAYYCATEVLVEGGQGSVFYCWQIMPRTAVGALPCQLRKSVTRIGSAQWGIDHI